MAPVLPDHDDATRDLLAGRLRAGLLLSLLGITVLSLSDPVAHPAQVRRLYPIDAIELAAVLGGLWIVRYATRSLHVIAIAFTVVSVLCVMTALSGIIVGDAATTPVLLLVLTLGTATLLPWGLWPQLALQAVATLSILWNVHALGGLASAATMPVAVVVGAVVALYGASDAARFHRERRRAEQGEAEVRARKHLAELVRDALHFAEVEARRLGIALRVELSPSPLEVEVDPVQIEQVVLNLVRNGFEASATRSHTGGDGGDDRQRCEVRIRTLRTPGGVQIAVSDTGPGMSPEVAARLFEPFFTTKHDGLGLGLSISRSIVDAHDGRLWVSTDSPRGATFHVELPRSLGARGVAA